MNDNSTSVKEHLAQFDFMRTVTMLGVILFHAAGAYGMMGSKYWPTHDTQNFLGSGIRELFDVFIMPFFMFIAGYFTLPSIRNKSFAGFFAGKFKRLYIYWIFLFVIMFPIGKYFSLQFDQNNVSYLTYLLDSFKNCVNVSNDPVSIAGSGHMQFWFISLLFYILILFGIIYKAFNKLFQGINIFNNTSYKKINLSNLLIFVSVAALCYFIFVLFFPGSYWFLSPNIIQFKTTHLPVLVSYFCFGVYAGYRGWFLRQDMPFNIKIWASLSLLFTIMFFITGQSFFTNIDISNTLSPVYLLIFSLIRSSLILFYLMLTISLANRYFTSQKKIIVNISEISYEIYLVHLIIIVVFQHSFLHFTTMPVTVKIFAVFILGTVTSYFIAKYTIYKFPKIIAGVLLAGFIFMIFYYR